MCLRPVRHQFRSDRQCRPSVAPPIDLATTDNHHFVQDAAWQPGVAALERLLAARPAIDVPGGRESPDPV